MNILQELKDRLEKCVKERDEVERLLKLNDQYVRYTDLQSEISEVSKAIRSLEHSCSPYGQQGLINQQRGY